MNESYKFIKKKEELAMLAYRTEKRERKELSSSRVLIQIFHSAYM